jgi:hypothetical protein
VGVLGGLLAFTLGFAVAGVSVLAGAGGGPLYLAGVGIGLAGVGVVGFFYHRGTVQLPQAKLWSPRLLRALVQPLNLPAGPVIGVLYVLGAVGLVGNLLIPLWRR